MRGPLSLAEELRAIRGGINLKSGPGRPLEPAKIDRPWQPDIDRVQQSLQEVLWAISRLSGVELPQAAPDSKSFSESLSRLDCTTLKDRIRNELEAFSVTTVSEMAKNAERQARAVLAEIQEEVGAQIERAAEEYREKLLERAGLDKLAIDVSKQSRERVAQLVQAQTDEFARWVWMTCKGTETPIPVQIEKMLEPYVEEATARFTGTIQQRIQELLDGQEQMFREKLQGTIAALEGQISTLEQAAQQICERNADSVTRAAMEKLDAAAEGAASRLEERIRERVGNSFVEVQTRLDETAAALEERLQSAVDQTAQGFVHRIEALASEVGETKLPEISTRMQQAVAELAESSLERLRRQAEEASGLAKEEFKSFLQQEAEEVVRQIQEAGQSAHESVAQNAAQVEDKLKGFDQELAAMQEKCLAAAKERLTAIVEETIAWVGPHITQEAGAAVRRSQDHAVAQFESRLREVSEGQYTEVMDRIRKEAGEAGAQATNDFRSTCQSALQELTEKVNASAAMLREQQAQAGSIFEASVKETLENYRRQLAEIAEAGMAEHRKSITQTVTDLQDRLKKAAELLVASTPMSE
jgi:hypothetical protein